MPVDEHSKIHPSVKIWHPELVNIYDSEIGEGTKIASFVEIGGSKIGKYCKIEAFAFIPPGSVIGDYVFIGPHVHLTNDKYPNLLRLDWELRPVHVRRGAKIGAGAVILPGVEIGEEAMIGAGAVVTKNVPAKTMFYGNPAKVKLRSLNSKKVIHSSRQVRIPLRLLAKWKQIKEEVKLDKVGDRKNPSRLFHRNKETKREMRE